MKRHWDWTDERVERTLRQALASKKPDAFKNAASALNRLSHGKHSLISPARAHRRAKMMLAAEKRARRRKIAD